MYIRMKIGRRAGEILDVEPVSARGLLASGGAEDPYREIPALTAEQPSTPSPAKAASRKTKHRQ